MEKGAGCFVSETEGLENASQPGDLPGKGSSTKPWSCLPLTHRHSRVTHGGAEPQLGPCLCMADFPICLWRLLDLIPQCYAHLGGLGFRECGELGLTTALKSPSPQLRLLDLSCVREWAGPPTPSALSRGALILPTHTRPMLLAHFTAKETEAQ